MKNNIYFIKLTTHLVVQAFAWCFTLLLVLNLITLPAPLNAEIVSGISLLLIMGQIQTKSRKIINLDNTVCDFLGKISYGIYLTHPILILIYGSLYNNFNSGTPIIIQVILVYSTVLSITILVSFLLYKYYERPFLMIKNNFSIIKNTNSKSVEF